MIDDCILTLLLGCRSSGLSQFSIPYVIEGGVRVSLLSDFSSIGYPESYPGTDPGAQKKENSPLQAQATSPSLRTFGRGLSERLKWPWNRTDSLSIERPDIIIIICLSYTGVIWHDGTRLDNPGAISDLQMLLYHLEYRHGIDDSRFRIITDFDCEFRDLDRRRAIVPRIRATRQNIKSAIKSTMACLERDKRCLIYCSGVVCQPFAYSSRPATDVNYSQIGLVAEDLEVIENWEFRRWLSRSRFSSSTVVMVLDASWTGSFLDLQYSYRLSNGDLEAVKRSGGGDHLESLVIEISAAGHGELAFSQLIKCDDGAKIWCGVLTLYLIRYLRENEHPNIRDLVSYLDAECYSWDKIGNNDLVEQIPLISSSKRLEGQVTLF